MTTPLLSLGWLEVLLLLVMMAAAVGLSWWLRLGVTRTLALGTVRAVVQLSTVGYVIGWVFRQQTWYGVLGLLALMTLVAGYTGARRSGVRMPGMVWLFTAVLIAMSGVTLLYLTQAVLGIREWEPRYLIPLGGMLLGNTMNSATLAVERLASELRRDGGDVEALLALGASPGQATREARRTAIRAAITPSLNSMLTVGIVTLPGMMTGQMLGGTDPFQAAMYQLMITFGIAFCTLSGAALAVHALAPRFFTPALQLRKELLRNPG